MRNKHVDTYLLQHNIRSSRTDKSFLAPALNKKCKRYRFDFYRACIVYSQQVLHVFIYIYV